MPKTAQPEEKRSILIVEDSDDFSNLMKYLIEDMGFAGVQFPVEEEDILGWAKKHNPSAILMDLALRKKGGMEFIGELKGDPETKNIPILIISGRELSAKEVLELQMQDVRYLRKGRMDMHEIKQAISEVAGKPASSPKTK
ncbi:MAG: response regulator [Ignavibacteria bacterium]|nr:response regulator [Ignavibacteria bacterium]